MIIKLADELKTSIKSLKAHEPCIMWNGQT